MKRILIAGADSFIGTSFERYMHERYPDAYQIDTVDMIGDGWRQTDFSGYDSLFLVAGLAHRKENKNDEALYYQVNRDLAIETARKAKAEGVKQLVFLSTMSVYGMETGVVRKSTPTNPKSFYGKSKLEAEKHIQSMADETFAVCIVRPPMVYGDGCKGNYRILMKIASICPILPTYTNQRSLIFVDNLAQAVKEYMDSQATGIFTPQDPQYVCTCEMIAQIRKRMGKRFVVTRLLNPLVRLSVRFTKKGRKAFGNLIYCDDD